MEQVGKKGCVCFFFNFFVFGMDERLGRGLRAAKTALFVLVVCNVLLSRFFTILQCHQMFDNILRLNTATSTSAINKLAKWRRDFPTVHVLHATTRIGSATTVDLAMEFSDGIVKCIHRVCAKWPHTRSVERLIDRDTLTYSETRSHPTQNLASSSSSPDIRLTVARSYRKCSLEEPKTVFPCAPAGR